jgi:colicin import membrane protein
MTEAVRSGGIDFGHLRRRELRRAAVISGIAHLGLLVAFVYSPQSTISVPRGIVTVELVAAPASAAPKAPAPARTEPSPPPPPARPEPKKVVLPAEPTTPKVVAKAVEKPKPRPKPVVAPPKPAPTPPAEQDLDDVLAQLRAESGQNREPVTAPAAPTATGPAGSPTGTPVSPEVLAWMKRAKIHVKRNWVVQPGFRTQMLETLVEVELDPSGAVRSEPRVKRRSGNPWYDEGVVRAIRKSSPLPAPPEAGTWSFVFAPEDSY